MRSFRQKSIGGKSLLEACEPRLLMATFPVTSAADAGAGSLREAINLANANPGLDNINFTIGSGAVTISPITVLPKLLDPTILDATTQPGFAGAPLVTLNGANRLFNGIHVSGGGSTVRGFNIRNFGFNGVEVDVLNGNVIEGNIITANGEKGIDINSSNNRIGGTTAATRNVISGNGDIGLDLSNGGTGNVVVGNYIGTDITGAIAQPNISYGLRIVDSSSNTVGGRTAAERNVISGNNADGIRITGLSSNNAIEGNYIGINAAGTAALQNRDNGITIFSPNNRVGAAAAGAGNVISGNRVDGVRVSGVTATGVVIQGNFIGTNPAGTAAIGNGEIGTLGTGGVKVVSAVGVQIGGTDPLARNIIAGNFADGVRVEGLGANGTIIEGNHIGTNAAGTAALGNEGDGVQAMIGAHLIGGTAAGAGNLISGNIDDGIELQTTSAVGSTIQGNRIGTDVSGLTGIANRSDGIELQASQSNQIGGTTAAARNIISGNLSDGIEVLTDLTGPALGNVVQNNYIGVNAAAAPLGNAGHGLHLKCGGNAIYGGSEAGKNIIAHNGLTGIFLVTSVNNDFSHNSIYNNGSLGIDIDVPGISPNDPLDADAGPNLIQNFPVILSAESGGGVTSLHLNLDSAPSTTYRIDIYSNDAADLSGAGEGKTWLARVTTTTDAAGHAEFYASVPGATGQILTATAMDPTNNTSEFAMTAISTADVSAPMVLSRSFDFDPAVPPAALVYQFSEDVTPSLDAGDFTVENLTTASVIPSSAIAIAFDSASSTARLTFPGIGGVLADGNYRVTLNAGGVTDRSGRPLVATSPLEFFVFVGDANRDRAVNINDFSILAARFNQPGTFSQGDFNYDGITNINDFSILAAKFNTSLPALRDMPEDSRAIVPGAGVVGGRLTSNSKALFNDRQNLIGEISAILEQRADVNVAGE